MLVCVLIESERMNHSFIMKKIPSLLCHYKHKVGKSFASLLAIKFGNKAGANYRNRETPCNWINRDSTSLFQIFSSYIFETFFTFSQRCRTMAKKGRQSPVRGIVLQQKFRSVCNVSVWILNAKFLIKICILVPKFRILTLSTSSFVAACECCTAASLFFGDAALDQRV